VPTPNLVACATCPTVPTKLVGGLCPSCRMKAIRGPAKYQWTTDMDDQIRQVYRRSANRLELTTEITKLCTAFRVPRTALFNRARTLDMNSFHPFKPWPDDEKVALRKLVGILSVKAIAKRMGRSPHSIKSQLFQMDLTAQLANCYSVRQLQNLLGVPNRSIQMWLTTKALRMDKEDRITEASVRKFVKNFMYEYSFRRVDEPWLKSLLSTRRGAMRPTASDAHTNQS
jgi:hypothetical protein